MAWYYHVGEPESIAVTSPCVVSLFSYVFDMEWEGRCSHSQDIQASDQKCATQELRVSPGLSFQRSLLPASQMIQEQHSDLFQYLPSVFPVTAADHTPAPFIHQLISKSKSEIFIGTQVGKSLRVAYTKKRKG